jgi:hypothetical protein
MVRGYRPARIQELLILLGREIMRVAWRTHICNNRTKKRTRISCPLVSQWGCLEILPAQVLDSVQQQATAHSHLLAWHAQRHLHASLCRHYRHRSTHSLRIPVRNHRGCVAETATSHRATIPQHRPGPARRATCSLLILRPRLEPRSRCGMSIPAIPHQPCHELPHEMEHHPVLMQ